MLHDGRLGIRVVLGVAEGMSFEQVGTRKGLGTDLALIRLLLGVHAHVTAQMVKARIAFGAFAAAVESWIRRLLSVTGTALTATAILKSGRIFAGSCTLRRGLASVSKTIVTRRRCVHGHNLCRGGRVCRGRRRCVVACLHVGWDAASMSELVRGGAENEGYLSHFALMEVQCRVSGSGEELERRGGDPARKQPEATITAILRLMLSSIHVIHTCIMPPPVWYVDPC